jgi:succinate dehydrogenase/fumarate reductase flavoprotein subunit
VSKDQAKESIASRSQSAKEDEMADEREVSRRLSRKDFVKGAAALAGAGALASCGPAATPAPTAAPAETAEPCPTCAPATECPPCPTASLPEEWDYEADVVVVGYGGAGAVTAIVAHDAGAEVLVLEKAPEGFEGGNSSVSGGTIYTPVGLEASVTYLNAMSDGYPISEEMVRTWAEWMSENAEFLRGLGAELLPRSFAVYPELGEEPKYPISGYPEFPELPGGESAAAWRVAEPDTFGRGGPNLWDFIKPQVEEERGITVLYETPGKQLVQDAVTKEILGVMAGTATGEVYVKARRAVVLTCGGFENSREMQRDFLTNLPEVYPRGTPYNTGDGIKMAMAVGADLWHMMNIAGPMINYKPPDVDYVLTLSPKEQNFIYIGPDGTRFDDEHVHLRHGKEEWEGVWVPSPARAPMYCIFDETVREAGRVVTPSGSGWTYKAEYMWSEDNSAEIASGLISQADTIAELAGKIDVDPHVLEAEVETYNGFCDAGEDLEFHRDPETLKRIETTPYYAMPLAASMLNTQGGARRNAKAQIVDTSGSPIPRLYSAGELGSLYSYMYNGGGNVGECVAFGRIAGQNAAAEEPWA